MFSKETKFNFYKRNLLPCACRPTHQHHFSIRYQGQMSNITPTLYKLTYSQSSLLKPENNFVDNHANLFLRRYLEQKERKKHPCQAMEINLVKYTLIHTRNTHTHSQAHPQINLWQACKKLEVDFERESGSEDDVACVHHDQLQFAGPSISSFLQISTC